LPQKKARNRGLFDASNLEGSQEPIKKASNGTGYEVME